VLYQQSRGKHLPVDAQQMAVCFSQHLQVPQDIAQSSAVPTLQCDVENNGGCNPCRVYADSISPGIASARGAITNLIVEAEAQAQQQSE